MRRPAGRPAAWIACVAAAWAGMASGEVDRVATEPTSGITIEVEGWAGINAPASGRDTGLIPLEFTITNASPEAHAWTIGPDERYGGSRRPLPTARLAVPAGGTGRATLFVGVGLGGGMLLRVSGHGVTGGSGFVNVAANPNPPTSPEEINASRRARGQSKRVLAARDDRVSNGQIVPLDAERAPTDWRGWSAFRKVLIMADDWRGMPAAARKAALDWVMLGGHLVVFAADADEGIDGLPRGAGPDVGLGAGMVSVETAPGGAISMEAIDRTGVGPDGFGATLAGYRRPPDPSGFPGGFPSTADEAFGRWDPGFAALAAAFGPRTLPVGAILVFLAVFGIVAGPLNVMVFAGPGRRARMFWTTPAISLAATALLLGLMFLRDGVGGSGARRVLALLDPDRATMAVIQEQFSRTGVLLGSSFPIREPSWMLPLMEDTSEEPLVEADGAVRSGGWFRSRSDQAYLLEAVRPSRARIEFVPGEPATGQPAVVSSVEVPLDRVFVIDDEGLYWQASEVGTGERKAMQQTSSTEFERWFATLRGEAGPVRRQALDAFRRRRGYAFASSRTSAKVAIATLPGIRWIDDQALFVCPTGPEAGP